MIWPFAIGFLGGIFVIDAIVLGFLDEKTYQQYHCVLPITIPIVIVRCSPVYFLTRIIMKAYYGFRKIDIAGNTWAGNAWDKRDAAKRQTLP